MENLRRILRKIDKRGYKAYKEIKGTYNFESYILFIDHVQGDPFATPSRVRVRVPQKVAGLPKALFSNNSRRTGLEDFLMRKFSDSIRKIAKGERGIGKSGLIAMVPFGQEVLKRSALIVTQGFVEARIGVGLPARGRTILGEEAVEIFFKELPRIIEDSLLYRSTKREEVSLYVETCEDADFIRKNLPQNNSGLV